MSGKGTSSQESQVTCDEMTQLPSNFIPGPFDVICARGNISQRHPGNRLFRQMLEKFQQKYSYASTKSEKANVLSYIVDKTRFRSPNGGFVKEKGGSWYEVGDRLARDKVAHGFRELLHSQYKSSHQSKKRRRNDLVYSVDDKTEEVFLQKYCQDLLNKFTFISENADNKSEEQIQILFNQTQSEFLQRIKRIGESDMKSDCTPTFRMLSALGNEASTEEGSKDSKESNPKPEKRYKVSQGKPI